MTDTRVRSTAAQFFDEEEEKAAAESAASSASMPVYERVRYIFGISIVHYLLYFISWKQGRQLKFEIV